MKYQKINIMLVALLCTILTIGTVYYEDLESKQNFQESYQNNQNQLDKQRDEIKLTYDKISKEADNVKRKIKKRKMPEWYQTSGPWAHLSYAHGKTVASNGCGLVSASMALSWCLNREINPKQLRAEVKDSCTVGGLNSMSKFSKYVKTHYGVKTSKKYYNEKKAVKDALSGNAVICSIRGRLGNRNYGRHIIVLYSNDGKTLRIRDPANKSNSNRKWTAKEIYSCKWAYFYTWTKE